MLNLAEKGKIMQAKLQVFFRCKFYQFAISAVILINCVILGLETSASIRANFGAWLNLADQICLWIFVVELVLRLFAFRLAFFTNTEKGWNIFDFTIVAISLMASAGVSVFRALRVFRVLRLLSVVPQMRIITEAMLHTLPSLFGVAILLLIFYFVYAVLCVNLFGSVFPEHFGSLSQSFFTLFQLMIMDDFGGVVRPIIERFSYAWLIFVSFVLIVGYVVLNLVVGIIVESISEIKERKNT